MSRRWRLAAEALASLVRQDYPPDLTLEEIARRWGVGLTSDHIAALAEIGCGLPAESGLGVVEDAPDVVEKEGAYAPALTHSALNSPTWREPHGPGE